MTFCTYERRRAFEAAEPVTLVRTQFRRTSLETSFALPAYCFMPDHVHLLVEGTADNSDAWRFIQLAKQYSGFYYQRAFGARLWQRYAHERVLRGEEDTAAVARYIVENPVRAGLVESVDEYPFLGSDVYSIAALLESIQLRRGWHRSG